MITVGVTLLMEVITMGEIEMVPGYDIMELLERADGPVVWAGKGAERLGLTGPADPDTLAQVFGTEPPPEEPMSLLDQMRADGSL